MKVLIVSLLFTLSVAGHAKWLKDGFSFERIGPKLNYRLHQSKNYLRFEYLGNRNGFFIEGCHKQIATSIDKFLGKKIHQFTQEGLRVPEGSPVAAVLKINGKEKYIYSDSRLQPSLSDIHTQLHSFMKLAEGLCKK